MRQRTDRAGALYRESRAAVMHDIEQDLAALRAEVNSLLALLPGPIAKLLRPILNRLLALLTKISDAL